MKNRKQVELLGDTSNINKEPMLEMFVFETNQLIEQLEEIILNSEESKTLSSDDINEIFRIMHTTKGSAAMMRLDSISSLAHTVEDLFYFIREKQPSNLDYSLICDLVLESSDFIKLEISKIQEGKDPDGDGSDIADKIKAYLSDLSEGYEDQGQAQIKSKAINNNEQPDKAITKESHDDTALNKYSAKVIFEDGCQMENIRAYNIIHNLKELCDEIYFVPENILEDNSCVDYIIENGFNIYFTSGRDAEELKGVFEQALFVKTYELNSIDSFEKEIESHFKSKEHIETPVIKEVKKNSTNQADSNKAVLKNIKQSLISVNITKLDKLMDLVGEIVITESMVTRNPDLKDLQLDNFSKATRQLRKLTDELQDTVMSMRMVPVAATFQKMHRIVRDMSKKLNKEVELILHGEDTEVDKNIIDHLSDPLMHLIRNAVDHGIESEDERIQKGKDPKGKVVLEANEAGGDVVISVIDDGRGLDRNKILQKAKEKGLTNKPDKDYTDREVFSFILLPGFSTNDNVTEYSGRGVGMDVVKKNIEQVGGSVFVESKAGMGTSIIIKIPLTLAIVDGMEVSTGASVYTIPITSIKESFKPNEKDLLKDTDGNEMIMIRGNCYPVIRLHRLFNIETPIQDLCRGIMVMVDGDEKTACLFVDKLIGQQQVVVKPLPSYLMRYSFKGSGIAGCTILGDGTISLILDAAGIINRVI